MLYLLFFLSGVSGLIYQVAWVRAFGNVFGNTLYSASLVVAIFMLGLGAGSYAVGAWADRRYARAPASLLRVYALVEIAIAALALGLSLLLPALDGPVARWSSYTAAANGWQVLTTASYAVRGALAVLLLAPITLLMGGTLTLLIRYLVRGSVETSGWTIALLYAVNTLGAAAGAFTTDFALVPSIGLFQAQMVAVGLNAVAGIGALLLARRSAPGSNRESRIVNHESIRHSRFTIHDSRLASTCVALACTGFAAMGLEILWLRHFTLLLGGFRAVFSLLLTVILLGIGAGALVGGLVDRRTRRPAEALMIVQALLVAAALHGLWAADVTTLLASGRAIEATLGSLGPWQRAFAELWYNVRPMLLEAGLPALLMGCSFPLANAIVQDAERAVGARAGLLYLASTAGGVCGSLAAGELLLQLFGIQQSATVLAIVGALAIPCLAIAVRWSRAASVAALTAAAAIGVWIALPADHLLARSLAPAAPGELTIALSEGATELIAVTEVPGRGRGLMTNGHAMSSTALLDQRYMRALAHIPLLAMERPARVLVIGFGVGNTTHAATLHPSVTRVEVADLSRHVLEHAGYFRDANGGVLQNPKVAVYLNDGRQHLQMQPAASYDLITLEPPPIAHAGVAALYSREFYALARSRLTPGGYLTQWLPAYQVPAASSLAMVRAFLDVFPQAVLLSGAQAELLLVGTTAPRLEIDPDRLAAALRAAPAVRDDLARLDLGTPREIVGTFVGAAPTLARATSGSPAVTDDRPLQEYGVRSVIGSGRLGVPASLFNLDEVALWCPRCFDGELVAPAVEGLDTYLSLLEAAYTAPVTEVAAASAAARGERRVLGSRYLGAVTPDSADVQNLAGQADYEAGVALLEAQRFAEAAARFRAAVRVLPGSAVAHNNLGVALASMGDLAGAAGSFKTAVALDPAFAEARDNLASALAQLR